MRYKDGEFEFEDGETEIRVFHKRRPIGTIETMVEASGRYCFRLGFDRRKKPRTYRGRVHAAQALLVIDSIRKEASRGKLAIEEVIVRAWDTKPSSAPS
ncbi:MAG: hypothetical protein FJ297_06070 [Planctomycetes bacterium]|nr:hypothetical protein [Planctomycetota bacterium]